MSAEAKPSHDDLMREAAHRIAPMATKLTKVLGNDGALLLLAAAGEAAVHGTAAPSLLPASQGD